MRRVYRCIGNFLFRGGGLASAHGHMDCVSQMENILATWPILELDLRQAFIRLTDIARQRPGSEWSVVSREGVSHSFRATCADPHGRRTRPVYLVLDVIISKNDPLFLSVCFYEDEISDPDGLGNPVPFGLYNETGYCFDVETYEDGLMRYLEDRIVEAQRNACKFFFMEGRTSK